MKRLSDDVDQFYRLRVIITFKSGRRTQEIFGPYTKESKTKEIQSRIHRTWAGFWDRDKRIPHANPDTVLLSIRYIREVLPSFGWYAKGGDTYTAD